MTPLSVLIADDERPARRFLADLLTRCTNARLVGEAASGDEALALIGQARPQLVLLDLQMPSMGGLEVAARLPDIDPPLVAFVTAFDDHAVEAFEVNAIDYLLKPVQQARLQATIDRAAARLAAGHAAGQAAAIASATVAVARHARVPYLDRLPVRQRDAVVLVPTRSIASVEAEGELLHISTVSRERYTITHRLHALEARLDPRRFMRLSRSTLVNADLITQVSPMPGGTYVVTLSTGQELGVSRIQSRVLRETFLKL